MASPIRGRRLGLVAASFPKPLTSTLSRSIVVVYTLQVPLAWSWTISLLPSGLLLNLYRILRGPITNHVQQYHASCHCQLVRYTVTLSPPLHDIESWVVECNCSICARNGYLNVYVQNDCIQFETVGLESELVEVSLSSITNAVVTLRASASR